MQLKRIFAMLKAVSIVHIKGGVKNLYVVTKGILTCQSCQHKVKSGGSGYSEEAVKSDAAKKNLEAEQQNLI